MSSAEKTQELLAELASQQRELVRTDQLLHAQQAKQEELTNEMLGFSTDLICQLHLLSLVRSRIVNPKMYNVNQIVSSQAFQGLKFSNLGYVPTFIDPNRLNHYIFFIAYLRRHPQVLAKIFYDYCKRNPNKSYTIAYSLFLTMFQQGWCVEEDSMLVQTLCFMSDLQYKNPDNTHVEVIPNPPRLLKFSLATTEAAVAFQQPFATFLTAYLFNGASMSFLQSALAPIIIKLQSLSQLYYQRSNFEVTATTVIAPMDYWKEIARYAHMLYDSMLKCHELLPRGLFTLLEHAKRRGANLSILFFESFVNRALENTAVLGLLPWHPGHKDWQPAKDIADVFRSKFISSLPSTSINHLTKLLALDEHYIAIDLDKFFDVFAAPFTGTSLWISETELLATNPSFPKEVLITGSDVILMHEAAASVKNLEDPELEKILQRLGDIPEKTPEAEEHFRIAITRQKEISDAAKNLVSVSLFSPESVVSEKRNDPYADQLCDIICGLPDFQNCINAMKPPSLKSFLESMRVIAPLFLKQNQILKADSVFDYALNNVNDDEGLVKRVIQVQESRAAWGFRATDRTSSLHSQHDIISSSMKTVNEIRLNVQSHLLLQVADQLVNGELCQSYREAMLRAHEFVSNNELFRKQAAKITDEATSILKAWNIDEHKIKQICRILFFKLTDHITFRKYTLTDQLVWKHSVIINKILETHNAEIIEQSLSQGGDFLRQRLHYLERAADMLGHIRENSGVSIILHYAMEVSDIAKTLVATCPELDFNSCILWVLASAKTKHVYLIGKFIQHFLLSDLVIESLFSKQEVNLIGIFPQAVSLLVDQCKQWDRRIDDSWK
ncbi:hypothetical protein TVAG_430780 [Trichomonas vaginalis G3]|uniref:Uncharacterized protein n=1 Tax=Trichomonas vaginalis (strain ATCC PRA-98 / G3) TaxID=412133 RepID=A2E3A1_TRIV3|nr:hypothetical protein TVAGG3_1017590 [Trichomonas vaginalis G3]EAY12911.1 hypothetical protein TVAG_430780 [Trichomonas vaginalis G3]KAI5491918.1 hypothetical protein TVAGG3_1017590 [Trichomonas vaginalis G3]|eukprot:XP_001325134.1 hypothetical protein [Trichomonas vaginalis G3]